jgi:hypothetical protein
VFLENIVEAVVWGLLQSLQGEELIAGKTKPTMGWSPGTHHPTLLNIRHWAMQVPHSPGIRKVVVLLCLQQDSSQIAVTETALEHSHRQDWLTLGYDIMHIEQQLPVQAATKMHFEGSSLSQQPSTQHE